METLQSENAHLLETFLAKSPRRKLHNARGNLQKYAELRGIMRNCAELCGIMQNYAKIFWSFPAPFCKPPASLLRPGRVLIFSGIPTLGTKPKSRRQELSIPSFGTVFSGEAENGHESPPGGPEKNADFRIILNNLPLAT